MAGTLELYAWVERAVKHIRFLPDRFGVRWELQNHMEDRYEALTAGGLDERAAAEQTVAAMGDADEVGRALNRLHSPLLGWAWLLSCAAVFLALLLCLSHMAFRPEATTVGERRRRDLRRLHLYRSQSGAVDPHRGGRRAV